MQNTKWQRSRVVSASDSQSGGPPGFESRSGHLLDLFSFDVNLQILSHF